MTKRLDYYAKKVVLLRTDNPKKKGSASWERFNDYFDLPEDATVGYCLTKTRIRMDDIRHDSEHGFIAVGDEAIALHQAQKEIDEENAIRKAMELLEAKGMKIEIPEEEEA